MRYSSLAFSIFLLGLAGCLTHGKQLQDPPSDFRAETLDYKRDTQIADSIVFAYPVNRKEIRALSVTQVGANPLRLLETETNLVVVSVFKGPALPQQIRFRHYQKDYRYEMLVGMPQGPSGKVGERGIFFLRRQSTGMFRSVVDVYRPDIRTPWIREVSVAGPCTDPPAECISRFLLTFRPSYNQDSFLRGLQLSSRISLSLIGYVNTCEVLEKLAEEANPDDVKRRACGELSEFYGVFPQPCRQLMEDSTTQTQYPNRVVHFREGLLHGGMAWVQARLQTKDEGEVLRYLQLLTRSSDDETRRISKRLLNSKKTASKHPEEH